MCRKIFPFFACFLFLASAFSQTDSTVQKKKWTFYGLWGYNRWAFTRSTIHFHNDGVPGYDVPYHGPYDFTIYNVSAHDSPDFESIKDVANITIPQFSLRFGFFMNNKKDEGWEINYDHAKYVVDNGQSAHIQGTILGQAVNKDSVLQYPYFHFEHTDGANFWQINYIKRWKLWKSKNGKNSIGWIFKPGAGVVVPRTDVTLFSHRLNNAWRLAGVIAGVETGLRIELFRHLCIEWTAKAAYTDYLWCYLQYKDYGNANHHFGTVGSILTMGYQFGAKPPCFRKSHKN